MPSVQLSQGNILKNNSELMFSQQTVKAVEIGEYNTDIPLDVAKSAIKDDGLDEIIFKTGGKTYIAYADGLDFSGLKDGKVPSSIFDGNLPMDVEGTFRGRKAPITILHIDNESNTYSEGAKNLFLPTLAAQAIPNGIQIGLAPAAAKAAEKGTNFMAKVTRFVGGKVSAIGTKLGIGPVGMGVAAGVLTLAAGVGGGAVYYGAIRGEDYAAVKGLMK